jgi:hypothetical protein
VWQDKRPLRCSLYGARIKIDFQTLVGFLDTDIFPEAFLQRGGRLSSARAGVDALEEGFGLLALAGEAVLRFGIMLLGRSRRRAGNGRVMEGSGGVGRGVVDLPRLGV